MSKEKNALPPLLLLRPFPEPIEVALDSAYRVFRLHKVANRDAFLAEVAPEVRGIATGGTLGASRALMKRLPALEIVAVSGVGTDAVDLAYASSRGIRVTTTPGVLTDDVADMAIGLMLAVSRRICEGDRFVRAGKWPGGGLALANRV